MTRLRNIFTRLFAVMALMLLVIGGTQAQGAAVVRFAHLLPNSVPVDIYVNGSLAITSLPYGSATNYLTVPAGEHTVTVTAAGLQTPLWEQSITASADSATTFIAASAQNPEFMPFNDNLTNAAAGTTRLLLVHALAGAPAVDVQLAEAVTLNGVVQDAGTPLATAMEFGQSVGSFDVPAQFYSVNVLPTGGTAFEILIPSLELPLASNTSYMAVVYGTIENPQALLLSAPLNPDSDSGFVRLIHGAVEAPAVDVYLDGVIFAPALSAGTATGHIPVSAGEHDVVIRAANTEDDLLTGTLTVTPGAAQTVIALAADDGVQISAFDDDLSGVTEDMGAVSVINAVPASTVTLALETDTPLAENLEFAQISDALTLAPITAEITYTLTFEDASGDIVQPATTFYGGVYYNVVVLPGTTFSAPSLLIAPTALNQTIGSAPGTASIETGVETAPPPAEEVIEATTAPQVQPTAASGLPQNVVTGRIILDPSANLQLRQYPGTEALSLGLAPSGTVLEINGREGRPIALVEGQEPPPEAETWEDPAEGLAEDEDLDPTQTWVNVTFYTPDGGEINAWVLSQYLDVRDPRGNRQRLADLPTVPENVAGQAFDTEITPPPPPEDRVTAVVTGINPGANLNLRRNPSADSEVLAQLPPDTVVGLIGFIEVEATENFPEDAEWAFVEYTPSAGGVVTGWVSTGFVYYEFNGRRVDAEELFVREAIEAVEAERIGRISQGAAQVEIATPDPMEDAYVAEVILNENANLQFRRQPDAQSESLNLIPSGTRLIIESRTPDSAWLKTMYEGETGWIASQFVTLTYNGNSVELEEIPVETGLQPAATPTGNG